VLARPPLGFAGAPLAPFGCPLALTGCALGVVFVPFGHLSMSALFLCSLGRGAMYDPYAPVHVLQGFAKSQKTHFSDALGQPDTHKRGQKRARRAPEGPRVAPETLDSYQKGAQAPYRESAKHEKQKR
jgi:hypothetical protein